MTNSVTTPRAIEVNLNDRVLFVLTDFGNECWDKLAQAEQAQFNDPAPRQKEKATNDVDDPTLSLPLWDFMNFFGPKMFVGSPNLFVENTVKIERGI